jgi:outer membrane receptor protein involved in Fe transport
MQGIDQEDDRGGIVDITTISALAMEDNEAHDDMDAYNYRLGINYEFGNGIIVDSNTAYIDYQRSSSHDNSSSPVPTNLQHRGEIFDLFSQELRFSSPRGGMIEWEAGAFYQTEDLDLGNLGDPKYQTITIRANIRRAARSQIAWQDTDWLSAFGSFTFNFFDDKASLDVGARFTDISKHSYIQGFAQTYIFDVNPIDHPLDPVQGDGLAQGTQHDDGDRIRDVVSGIEDDAFGDPRNGIIDCGDTTDNRRQQCGDFGAGFYTHAWQVRTVPDAWDTLSPVGIGPVIWGIRRPSNNDIYDRVYNDNSFDPQVTLRYRPTDNISLYAKWARAFKGGGADISTASLPTNQDAFPLQAENAENFEIGAKGTLLDGRANFNITAFQITISDLQIATTIPEQLGTQNSFSTNAGKQRTRGIEFDGRWAVTDQLTLGLAGALMDGEMVKFEGAGCTDIEFEEADTGPCISEAESLAQFGNEDGAGLIDRSGAKAPRTPEYKFILDVDWWYPISNRVKYIFSSKTSFIDGYIYNVEDFREDIKFDNRIVQNLNIGLADMDDRWNVTFWGRNLFDEGFTYFPEFDVDPSGRADKEVSPRHWFSYGVQFQYKYN